MRSIASNRTTTVLSLLVFSVVSIEEARVDEYTKNLAEAAPLAKLIVFEAIAPISCGQVVWEEIVAVTTNHTFPICF